MKFLLEIVRPFLPDIGSRKPSIACISTSNPVYLVFQKGLQRPELVVRSAGSTDVVKAHKVTQLLFNEIPHLIPEPVALINTESGEFAIQRGVDGQPWFQIANEFNDESSWKSLRRRALETLEEFHQAVKRTCDKETGSDVYGYAQNCLSEAQRFGLTLTDEESELLQGHLSALKNIPQMEMFPQHGDFCLNNLIVANERISIIDFEDFGMTSLPLFDHFSLALSLASSTPKSLELSFEKEISFCTSHVASRYGLKESQINALYIAHIIVRLGEWSSGDRRKVFRDFLLETLKATIHQ